MPPDGWRQQHGWRQAVVVARETRSELTNNVNEYLAKKAPDGFVLCGGTAHDAPVEAYEFCDSCKRGDPEPSYVYKGEASHWALASILDGGRQQSARDLESPTESCSLIWTNNTRIYEPEWSYSGDRHAYDRLLLALTNTKELAEPGWLIAERGRVAIEDARKSSISKKLSELRNYEYRKRETEGLLRRLNRPVQVAKSRS